MINREFTVEEVDRMLDRAERAEAERDKIQKFKTWVHTWLDSHGVPKEFPDGPHTKEGCRIGDRMEWLWEKIGGPRTASHFSIWCAFVRNALVAEHLPQPSDELLATIYGTYCAPEVAVERVKERMNP